MQLRLKVEMQCSVTLTQGHLGALWQVELALQSRLQLHVPTSLTEETSSALQSQTLQSAVQERKMGPHEFCAMTLLR